MMIAPPKASIGEDFEQIEAAVLETERGRWFLQEYSRRVRAAETTQILAAIERLGSGREELVARREAAEAAAAMIEALQKLANFALGATGRETAPPRTRRPEGSGDLDRRLSALKELDALDVEAKVKLFG